MHMPAAQIMSASGERVEVEIAPGEYISIFVGCDFTKSQKGAAILL